MPLMASDLAGEREVSMTSRDVPLVRRASHSKTVPLSHRRPVPPSSEHTVKRSRSGASSGKVGAQPNTRSKCMCEAGRGGRKETSGATWRRAQRKEHTAPRACQLYMDRQTTYENAGAMMRRCVLWSSPSAHTRPLPRTFATGGLNAGDFTASGRGPGEKKNARQCLRFTVQSHKPREEILSSRADGLLPETRFH